MGIGTDDLGRITQQTSVIGADGERLGTINQIYTSDVTGDPAWVTLKTGLFGTRESFVPLGEASFDGDDVRVPVTKDAVHGAPQVEAGGHLSPEEEDELYRHYGLHNPDRPDADAVAAEAPGTGRDLGERRDRQGVDERVDERSDADSRDDEHDGGHAAEAAAVGAAGAGGLGAAHAGRDRDDELAARDAEGRDEVADRPEGVARHAADDQDAASASGTSTTSTTGTGDADEAVRPGERTTRLRRYVVTERVVQTVEELPDDEQR